MGSLRRRAFELGLLLSWIVPILLSISTLRFVQNNSESAISIIYGLYLLFVIVFIILNKIRFDYIDRNPLIIYLLIFIPIILSDYHQVLKFTYWSSYALIIAIIFSNYFKIIINQYLIFCEIIFYLTLIELIYFFTFNNLLISATPIEMVYSFPRINTIFDEMSHQAFFLLPGFLISLIQKRWKLAFKICFAYIFTLSISFIAFLPFSILLISTLYGFKKKYFLVLMICIILNYYLFEEFIFDKFYPLINFNYINDHNGELTFAPSATGVYIAIKLLINEPFSILLIGRGYFREYFDFSMHQEILNMQYKFTLGEIERLPGIFDAVFSYGIIILAIIMYLLLSIRASIKNKIYFDAGIIAIIFFMFYNPHYVDYPPFIFIFFGIVLSYPTRLKNDY